MHYEEAIAFLKNLTKFGMNFGLARIEKLLSLMGDPHLRLRFVHVGGTNGKGSVCAITSNILKHAGYKVGLFTSPHIHSYCERFKINGDSIDEERLASLITKIRPHLEEMVAEGYEHPTEFEVSTALALQYFYEEGVDIAVMEVGLGGAIDSTNVINPLVAVITNVEKDHMDYLGNTIEEITAVKAGIIKKGISVITAIEKKEALKVVEDVCRNKSAQLFRVTGECWNLKEASINGTIMDFYGDNNYYNLFLPLIGRHQVKNAAIAIKVAEELGKRGYKKIDPNSIRKGVSTAEWPLRMELIKAVNKNVLLDVAHNVSSMTVLKDMLKEFFKDKKIILLIGLLQDKERKEIVEAIVPLADMVIVTKPDSPRAGDWERVAKFAENFCTKVVIEPVIDNAVKAALCSANESDLVCITGSFYMVCKAREIIKKLTERQIHGTIAERNEQIPI